jgi:hypothetical protein
MHEDNEFSRPFRKEVIGLNVLLHVGGAQRRHLGD